MPPIFWNRSANLCWIFRCSGESPDGRNRYHFASCSRSAFSLTLDEVWYQRIVKTEVAPLLREYWFDKPKQAQVMIDHLLDNL
jgi:hypothetical protein